MDKEELTTSKNEIFGVRSEELLKKLVDEAIKYNQQQTELIKEFRDRKILKGKNSFRFPFLLKEDNVKSFDECIKRRLKSLYDTNYQIKFICMVEFENNDKLIYKSIKEFFEATHKEKMLRVNMNWEYTVNEELDGETRIAISIPYDIIIRYEVEQDTDEPELYSLEEWGGILIEGSNNDWINTTLEEIKILTQATKMPFWWYYPKKVLLLTREYMNVLIWIIVTNVMLLVFAPSLLNFDEGKKKNIEETQKMPEAAQKIQAYIEYTLTSSSSLGNQLIYYIIVMGGKCTFNNFVEKRKSLYVSKKHDTNWK